MYLDFITTVAKKAGDLLLEKKQVGFEVSKKIGLDLVTDADKASEELIVKELMKKYPTYSVFAEETGWAKNESEFTWLIDPLDGTANYVHDLPHYSVSIALLHKNQPIVGVVYNPILQELFCAEKGKGATLNGQLIKVSSAPKVQDGLFVTGFSGDRDKVTDISMTRFHKITKESHGVRRLGGGALDTCYVACGRLEGFWENPINAWDIGAGVIIVLEAGGKVSGISGGTLDLFAGEILATNGLVHDELVELLKV